MEQLLLHLVGDYITQSDWMATNKAKRTWPAVCHVMIYGLPFLLIGSVPAVAVIIATHFVVDRFRLAPYIIWTKNWLGPGYRPWKECSDTGYDKNMPVHMSFWLVVIVDNTLHLVCNYCALRWL